MNLLIEEASLNKELYEFVYGIGDFLSRTMEIEYKFTANSIIYLGNSITDCLMTLVCKDQFVTSIFETDEDLVKLYVECL